MLLIILLVALAVVIAPSVIFGIRRIWILISILIFSVITPFTSLFLGPFSVLVIAPVFFGIGYFVGKDKPTKWWLSGWVCIAAISSYIFGVLVSIEGLESDQILALIIFWFLPFSLGVFIASLLGGYIGSKKAKPFNSGSIPIPPGPTPTT